MGLAVSLPRDSSSAHTSTPRTSALLCGSAEGARTEAHVSVSRRAGRQRPQVHFLDGADTLRAVVLKKVENSVETKSGLFLVMEYVPHEPESSQGYDRSLHAVHWLAKVRLILPGLC